MDAAGFMLQGEARTRRERCLHLSHDRKRDLFRRIRADVQSGRAMQAGQPFRTKRHSFARQLVQQFLREGL